MHMCNVISIQSLIRNDNFLFGKKYTAMKCENLLFTLNCKEIVMQNSSYIKWWQETQKFWAILMIFNNNI